MILVHGMGCPAAASRNLFTDVPPFSHTTVMPPASLEFVRQALLTLAAAGSTVATGINFGRRAPSCHPCREISTLAQR